LTWYNLWSWGSYTKCTITNVAPWLGHRV